MNQYELYGLINVFDVNPTFLLPIFKKGEEYYFQDIYKNKINSFSRADLTQFKNCKIYNINDRYVFKVQCPAFYGIEKPNSSDYYIGDSTEIIRFYNENRKIFDIYPQFTKTMDSFISENNHSNKDILQWRKHLIQKDIRRLITDKCDVSRSLVPVKQNFSNNYNCLEHEIFDYIYELDFYKTKKQYDPCFIESSTGSFAINPKYIFKTDNIFYVWELLKSQTTFENVPFIQYTRKNRFVPLSVQMELLDYIMARSNAGKIYNVNLICYLMSLLFNSFEKSKKYKKTIMDKIIKKDWGLDINPTSTAFNIENIESLFLFDEMDSTFWFGIKKLSPQSYAIIVKHCASEELLFCIANNYCGTKNIINFIQSLYETVNNKITLIPCCDESEQGIFNDEFSNWLNLNEDICTIKGTQSFINKNSYDN